MPAEVASEEATKGDSIEKLASAVTSLVEKIDTRFTALEDAVKASKKRKNEDEEYYEDESEKGSRRKRKTDDDEEEEKSGRKRKNEDEDEEEEKSGKRRRKMDVEHEDHIADEDEEDMEKGGLFRRSKMSRRRKGRKSKDDEDEEDIEKSIAELEYELGIDKTTKDADINIDEEIAKMESELEEVEKSDIFRMPQTVEDRLGIESTVIADAQKLVNKYGYRVGLMKHGQLVNSNHYSNLRGNDISVIQKSAPALVRFFVP